MLEIVKASAGSGKTYELTGQYIQMLFKESVYTYSNYKTITISLTLGIWFWFLKLNYDYVYALDEIVSGGKYKRESYSGGGGFD